MTVTEALKIVQRALREQPRWAASLACGFTPLHLQLFVKARLQERLSHRQVEVTTGLYGQLAGTLEGLANAEIEAVAIAVEWPDLDPRLGYREAANWSPAAVHDMVSGARATLDRIRRAIERLPAGVRIAASMPTLPFPPVFHTAGWQAGQAELLLEESAAQFAAGLLERRGVTVVNARRLQAVSPAAERLDVKSDLATGLPYTLAHADRMAEAFAHLLAPDAPKKGVITDLDDTLWRGIVGDAGVAGVSWDLASHSQLHGLYQQLLASLADAGVLIAIASKNDPATVHEALRRDDLLLRPQQIFPVEAHWDAKSGSVARILRAWNIGADAVLFVDDSPMELAEVEVAHPGITCLRFPTGQPAAALELFRKLRDFCGKEHLSADDALRLDSIRRGAEFHEAAASNATPEDFLRSAGATLTVDYAAGPEDARALELVNKTNQFNINGARRAESEWRDALARPGAFLAVVSYTDKFGPLGKIGVIQGRASCGVVSIDTWVMSCRAFARRIEHQCLKVLFDRFDTHEMEIHFAPTPKNGPSQDFFAALTGSKPEGVFRLRRAALAEKSPPLYHQVVETGGAELGDAETGNAERETVETNG